MASVLKNIFGSVNIFIDLEHRREVFTGTSQIREAMLYCVEDGR
jgi:predicted component of viral defense system (DUF524 family)